MCGEKPFMVWLWVSMLGSPPHVRGKASPPSYRGWRQWDHPRVCGENALSTFSSRKNSGSPPHMRGKSSSPPWAISPARDHPRVCGEKFTRKSAINCGSGSPPHVRGKGLCRERHCLWAGITPACAGKRSGPSPAAVPAGPAGSCQASRPSQFPPRMTVISPRP